MRALERQHGALSLRRFDVCLQKASQQPSEEFELTDNSLRARIETHSELMLRIFI